MRPSPRVVGVLCAAAMIVTACTSSAADPGEDVTTEAAVTESSSPTEASPSPSPSDPFAMPDPVTKEYVDRVVNTLYEEWGAITREILEQPADPAGINPVPVRERIAALFSGENLQNRLWEADAMLRGERDNLLPPDKFSSIQWRTRHIYRGDSDCLVAAGNFDTSGTAVESTSLLTAISLEPVKEDSPPHNPTGWRIRDALANTGKDGEELDDSVMLEASLAEFGDLLTTACGEKMGG